MTFWLMDFCYCCFKESLVISVSVFSLVVETQIVTKQATEKYNFKTVCFWDLGICRVRKVMLPPDQMGLTMFQRSKSKMAAIQILKLLINGKMCVYSHVVCQNAGNVLETILLMQIIKLYGDQILPIISIMC